MGCLKFVPSWVLKFHSVGELSCWGCELEIQCQIAYPSVTGKVRTLQKMNFLDQFCVNFLACVIHTVPELKKIFCVLEGRAESALSFGFYKVRDEGFPPFPKEKIDIGGFCGITFGIFLPIPKYGSFFSYFFFVFFFFFFFFE